jgi:3-hydroxyisobutyrate dehydrogenase-like beta-hydroxyacid dehydrogenase
MTDGVQHAASAAAGAGGVLDASAPPLAAPQDDRASASGGRVVGFVGLGNMGRGMASCLVDGGFDLVVSDRDEARVRGLEEQGARGVKSIAELGSMSDVVFLALPGPAEVREVALGDGGLLEVMTRGSTLINTSTVSPAVIDELVTAAGPRGISIIDAPVSGAADGARAGSLTIMVGGSVEAIDACRDVLDAISATIVRVGDPGHGTVTKLVTNMLWFVHVVALSDALGLAYRAGVAPEALAAAVPRSAGASWAADHDLPNILAGDDDPSFTLALCCKDLNIVDELRRSVAAELPLFEATRKTFLEALDRFGGEAGELAVTRLSEERCGASIRAGGGLGG